MITRVRSPKDFWAGALYAFFGLAAIYIGRDYGMGSALRMGAAYFPSVLGGALLLIGVASLVRSFLVPGEPVGRFALKPLALIVGASLLFGFLIRDAGLAIAIPVLVFIGAYASVKFRWAPTLALAAGVTVFCILVFVKGLGIPLPILGSWFGG